ncbi:MAG: hypothetical protein DVB23_003135 [Verrucomicrobia bacterium]|nr:MAG: hypothetical protein DVB23_003135 [Verrucomicrobiota bacterium]
MFCRILLVAVLATFTILTSQELSDHVPIVKTVAGPVHEVSGAADTASEPVRKRNRGRDIFYRMHRQKRPKWCGPELSPLANQPTAGERHASMR